MLPGRSAIRLISLRRSYYNGGSNHHLSLSLSSFTTRNFPVKWLSTVADDRGETTSSRSVLSSKIAEANTEDYLVAHTDRLAIINNRYHPVIVRAFREAKDVNSKSTDYQQLLNIAERALANMNEKLQKKTSFRAFQRSYLPLGVVAAREKAERILPQLLRRVTSCDELKGIAAVMHILQPQSTRLWQDFDRLVHSKIPLYDYQFSLLMSFTISQASRSLKMEAKGLKTLSAVMERYAKAKTEYGAKNVFGSTSSVVSYEKGLDVLAPIGSRVLRDHQGVESLSLQLYLVSIQPWSCNKTLLTPEKRKILEDLTNHGLSILQSLHSPVKLHTFQYVWEVLPYIDLPDSYLLYKTLYSQIINSISTQPLQLVQHDDTFISLLESMIISKFKSSQLIEKIYTSVIERGYDYSRIGIRLFNALVQLEAYDFASVVLEKVMKQSSMRLDSLFSYNYSFYKNKVRNMQGKAHHSNSGVLTLSEETKDLFFRYLFERSCQLLVEESSLANVPSEKSVKQSNMKDTHTHLKLNTATESLQAAQPLAETSVDSDLKKRNRQLSTNLILALLYFNREDKRSAYYKLLEQLEYAFFQRISPVLSDGKDQPTFNQNLIKNIRGVSMNPKHASLASVDKIVEHLAIPTLPPAAPLLSCDETIMIYYTYALAGRHQIFLLNALDVYISHYISTLTSRHLPTLIWACGRLNKQPAYLPAVVEKYFQSLRGLSKLSSSGGMLLSRSLWSLAVLQLLSLDTYMSVHNLLLSSVKDTFAVGVETNIWMTRQLHQVTIELRMLVAVEKEQFEKQHVATDTTRPLHMVGQCKVDDIEQAINDLENVVKKSKSYKYLQRRAVHDNISSNTHLDASHILKDIGAYHENEKLLDHGYYCDIFLSPQYYENEQGNADQAIHKGIVIEFDGPWHFDSYLEQPLGPTVLKRRQTVSSGYKLISLPYWLYKMDMSKEHKLRVMREALTKINQ